LVIISSVLLFSCKTTKDLGSVESDVLPNALLWKISGNDISAPSYLFGTIHLINADDFFYPKGTMQALEATKDIYFEIDMDDMSDMSKMMGLMDQIFMDDGVTLKDLLSKEDYTMINDHFSEMGLPIFMLEKMKPMFLTAFASGDIDMGSLFGGAQTEESSTKSYEFEFYELAEDMNKSVSGLETIEYQMSIFDKIPYEDQANMLVESIKATDENEDGPNELDIMTKMYVDQDINAMVNMIDEDPTGFGKYNDILLVDRNKNWIPIMAEKMSSEPTFFAVGAGHLAGEFGVINLLKSAGYKLEPISNK